MVKKKGVVPPEVFDISDKTKALPVISIQEFVASLPLHNESAKAFAALVKNYEPLPIDEWQRLFGLFQKKPMDAPWEEWVKNGGSKL